MNPLKLDIKPYTPENKYRSDYNKCCSGPYVDTSKLHRAMNMVGMFDTPYNRSILSDGAIDITYFIGQQKITFNFVVTGWDMIDTESTDEDDGYCVSVQLNSITQNVDNYNFDNNYYLNGISHPTRGYEWFISRAMWMVKDLTFATDLIMDYEFCGNQHHLPDGWYDDLEFVKKLFTERDKLNELKKDFE